MKVRITNCIRLAFIVGLGGLGVAWGCSSRVASRGTGSPQSASVPAEPGSTGAAVMGRGARSDLLSGESDPADCQLSRESDAGQGERVATVALGEDVDPTRAPHPSNESERLLFRQLYETLVRVDCDGRVGPGLAASWQWNTGGQTWIVSLRPDARFSDGTPVTAADVVSAWTISGLTRGIGSELRPEVRRLVRSALAIDDRTLEIALRSQRDDPPLALAHTDLAIVKPVPGSVWPLGTRGARIETDSEAPAPAGTSVIDLIQLPVGSESARSDEAPVSVRFLVATGRDPRDLLDGGLLDGGVDLLVTRDPTALEYAAALPEFVAVPLAWKRTHVLVVPGRASTAASLSAAQRETVAHDAIRGEARGAAAPFWWQSLSEECDFVYAEPRQRSPTTGRLVYESGDSVARDLAERLVGLVRTSGPGASAILDALLPDRSGGTFDRAAGLTGEALGQARRSGNDAGYIVALASQPLDACLEMQALVDQAGWVDPETIVPLADTRLVAIVRRGRSGVTVEWDGALLLVDSGT